MYKSSPSNTHFKLAAISSRRFLFGFETLLTKVYSPRTRLCLPCHTSCQLSQSVKLKNHVMGACVTMLFSAIALVSAERIQTLIGTQLVVTFERLMGLDQTNSYSTSRLMFFVMGHFLKQTQNPFKKYFPHTDQRLIGVEPRVWKQCGRNREICWVFKQI